MRLHADGEMMSDVRVLLGSGGIRGEQKVALYQREMTNHFADVSEVLFIPYAVSDHAGSLIRMRQFGGEAAVNLVGIHSATDPKVAVREAEAIYVGGGNTFLLTRQLHNQNLLKAIRERVAEGMPYMGVSAGSNVAGPTMQTTNDMPIVMPPSFETLGIVPFQVNPHYISGQTWVKHGEGFVKHHGETRAKRIREFHEHNETPVIGLSEGTYRRWNGDFATLVGGPAVVHKSGIEGLTYDAGTVFSADLTPQR